MQVVHGPEAGDGQRASSEAQTSEVSLPAEVEAMLRDAGPNLRNRDLLVLPPYYRDGHGLYGPDDVDAVRLARNTGLNAAFLHDAADREYLHEYSAGWAVEFAIALGANVATVGLTALIGYLMSRASKAVDEGLHAGPVENVPLRVTVANFQRDSDGATTVTGLKIEGPAPAVAETIRTLLWPGPQA